MSAAAAAAAAGASAAIIANEEAEAARRRRLSHIGNDQVTLVFHRPDKEIGYGIAQLWDPLNDYHDGRFWEFIPFTLGEVAQTWIITFAISALVLFLIGLVYPLFVTSNDCGPIGPPSPYCSHHVDPLGISMWISSGWYRNIGLLSAIIGAGVVAYVAHLGDHYGPASGGLSHIHLKMMGGDTIVRIDKYDDDGYRNFDDDFLYGLIAKLENKFGPATSANEPMTHSSLIVAATIECQYCHAKNPTDAQKCSNCGAVL